MDYCGPRGIPHSHFLGGPPQWTDEDRDKALWWLIHDNAKCPNCGTRPDEWDPAKGGHDHAYLAELHKCWGCDTSAGAEQAIDEKDRGTVSVRLTRNPEALT
ncbi:hypothetical protein GCM10023403_10690 [Pseudonocardia benzenivorans]|uniref:hypothetical protein n=1 Tax=Pseudonocardia benzenivorans TaxID=228005 RepID=UPI0031F88B09